MTTDHTTAVERRYARLVNLYPAHYPRDEILDTVLQSTARFTAREAFSLLTGAFRARTGADVHRGPAEFLQSATRLAALALLVQAAAGDVLRALPLDLTAILQSADGIVQYATAGLLALILHVTAIVTLTRGAYRVAAAAAVLGLVASILSASRFGGPWMQAGFGAAPLAALLAGVLACTRRRERSAPLWWLLAVPPAVILLPTGSGTVLSPALFIESQAFLALTAVAVAWSLLDARVPVAVAALGICNLITIMQVVLLNGIVGDAPVAAQVAVSAAPTLVLLIAATVSRRRSPI
ncbi:hypothetical protein Aph02nite_82320 [Actinoplanes philippinensis]|uniref:Uncharacterized protein n=1 Tax=Actinoplanes philippinensis TaxID=35752 RepID=A0A1I2LSS3_9ACTN|nr:hypothetical protein [Actinoplanes philippinensis]GIE82282.1 hypothetical protein Aph02nite_82320 [Actinoplanes philippinensis]SFF82305.1 hypothetical protein SAMN05421541_12411 [Actinoplanes philippinensis]